MGLKGLSTISAIIRVLSRSRLLFEARLSSYKRFGCKVSRLNLTFVCSGLLCMRGVTSPKGWLRSRARSCASFFIAGCRSVTSRICFLSSTPLTVLVLLELVLMLLRSLVRVRYQRSSLAFLAVKTPSLDSRIGEALILTECSLTL